MLKRLLNMLLVAVMTLVLVACGTSGNSEAGTLGERQHQCRNQNRRNVTIRRSFAIRSFMT